MQHNENKMLPQRVAHAKCIWQYAQKDDKGIVALVEKVRELKEYRQNIVKTIKRL